MGAFLTLFATCIVMFVAAMGAGMVPLHQETLLPSLATLGMPPSTSTTSIIPNLDVVQALGAGLLSFAYLYAISIKSVPMAISLSLLMWGVIYQGYNAVYPSFYPEMFPTRSRVTGMAIAQNTGTMLTAMMPALFAAVAPPGSTNIPLMVGSITLAVTAIAALAAWSARETYRVQLKDLGNPNAVPVSKVEYDQLRAQALTAV